MQSNNIECTKNVIKNIQSRLKNDISSYVDICKMYDIVVPKLVTMQIGEDGASKRYINNKIKLCNELGVKNEHIGLNGDFPTSLINDIIDKKVNEFNVDGIMVQLPIELHGEDKSDINWNNIPLLKDVDGLTEKAYNSYFHKKEFTNIPCTARGVIQILNEFKIDVVGKTVLVLGKGKTSGHPISLLLQNMGATVLNVNSKTTYSVLVELLEISDIIISCTGTPHIINKENISKIKSYDAIINVGMSISLEGKLVGDIDVEGIKDLPNCLNTVITPIIGSTGVLTVTNLLLNVCISHYLKYKEILPKKMTNNTNEMFKFQAQIKMSDIMTKYVDKI